VHLPLTLWDVTAGKELPTFRDHRSLIQPAFSPDGRILATRHMGDRTIHLLDVATGKERCRFEDESPASLVFSPDGNLLVSVGRASIVWDVTGHAGGSSRERLAEADLEDLWFDLASDDASVAHRAIWRLASDANSALPYLKKRTASRPDLEPRVKACFARLDDDDFDVREEASRELERMGRLAEPALRRLAVNATSAETRRRSQRLLDKLGSAKLPMSVHELLALRTIEVLEHIGTAEARSLVATWANESDDGRVKQDAERTLHRLNGGR
jgi:hypothetical protein